MHIFQELKTLIAHLYIKTLVMEELRELKIERIFIHVWHWAYFFVRLGLSYNRKLETNLLKYAPTRDWTYDHMFKRDNYLSIEKFVGNEDNSSTKCVKHFYFMLFFFFSFKLPNILNACLNLGWVWPN